MVDEQTRLAALRDLDILDTAAEERFDRLVRLANRVLPETTVLLGFMDEHRLWLKAHTHPVPATFPRDQTFCQHVIADNDSLLITDKATDPRRETFSAALLDNPVAFYFGHPVHAPDGSPVGVLCAFAEQPLPPPDALQRDALNDLVALAEEYLRLRRSLDTQRQLLISEQRYRALSESNPDAVYIIDTEGVFTSCNPAVTALTGYRETELIGTRFQPLLVPEDVPIAETAFARCLGGSPQQLRLRLRHRSGDTVHVSVSVAPYVAAGETLGVVGVSRDISEFVNAERRLDLALESSGQGIWEWDRVQDRVFRSSHLRQVLGEPDADAWEPPEQWQNRLHAADRPVFMADVEAVIRGGTDRFQCEGRLHCGDRGYRWFQCHARVLERTVDGSVARLVGAVADIHDLKLAEDQRLREAGRMALAVRAGGAGTFELNLHSGETFLDEAMRGLLGLERDGPPVTIETMTSLLHPDDRTPFSGDLGQARRLEAPLDRERRVLWPDGTVHHLRLLGRVMEASDGSALLIGTGWDVTQARAMERQLAHQARHDALTGLYNRYEFERRLTEAQRAMATEGSHHSVCFIDLDRFKIVNDTAGHAAGDALLRELADMLRGRLRTTDVLARLGGDEFGLIAYNCRVESAEELARTLVEAIQAWSFHWAGRTFRVGASIGIADLQPAGSVADAMSQADVACYTAKVQGRGRVAVYEASSGDAEQHHRQLRAAADIREALAQDRFELHGQPIVSCRPESARHELVEMLVRMLDEDGERVRPDAFIPAAERYEQMAAVDRWVIENALTGEWAEAARHQGWCLSINLSAQSVNDEGFIEYLDGVLARTPLAAADINFEITETALMTHLASARTVVAALRRRGCTVALDDFGSGLSSFGYLRHFRVDYVKIDGGFVKAMPDSDADRIIVESINDLAHRLGARTVAEYVEDERTLTQIRALGVDYAQGYGIARPAPLSAMNTDPMTGLSSATQP